MFANEGKTPIKNYILASLKQQFPAKVNYLCYYKNKSLVLKWQNIHLGRRFTFQRDNNPKPSSKFVSAWL